MEAILKTLEYLVNALDHMTAAGTVHGAGPAVDAAKSWLAKAKADADADAVTPLADPEPADPPTEEHA